MEVVMTTNQIQGQETPRCRVFVQPEGAHIQIIISGEYDVSMRIPFEIFRAMKENMETGTAIDPSSLVEWSWVTENDFIVLYVFSKGDATSAYTFPCDIWSTIMMRR